MISCVVAYVPRGAQQIRWLVYCGQIATIYWLRLVNCLISMFEHFKEIKFVSVAFVCQQFIHSILKINYILYGERRFEVHSVIELILTVEPMWLVFSDVKIVYQIIMTPRCSVQLNWFFVFTLWCDDWTLIWHGNDVGMFEFNWHFNVTFWHLISIYNFVNGQQMTYRW